MKKNNLSKGKPVPKSKKKFIIISLCAVAAAGLAALLIALPEGKSAPNPVATITMKSGDVIRIELYPRYAPNTVTNFISLANSGFYDGTIFHRVIDGFMIQGGDPTGTGRGNPGYFIAGEFSDNGYTKNTLKHTPGVISMARSDAYDSAGSQFFIMISTKTYLDGRYAAFGKVMDDESLAVCYAIGKSETDDADRPLEDQTIESIRVETYGKNYGQPKTVG
jgi:peptidyl-prolyl cis-trans isomerase B (cyclophilin B)